MTPLLLSLHIALSTLVQQAPPPPPLLDEPADASDPAGPGDAPDELDVGDPADDEQRGPDDRQRDDLTGDDAAQPRPDARERPRDDEQWDDERYEDEDWDDEVDSKRERFKRQRRRNDDSGGVLPDDALDPFLVLPLQIALGVVLSNATAILWPIAPIIVATAQVVLGDLIGPNRGAVVPSAVAGYAGMFACGLTPLLIAGTIVGGLFALVFLVPSLAASVTVLAPLAVTLLYPALLVGLPSAHCGNSIASSVTYFMMSEPKRPGDSGFRYPGVFAPAHQPDDERWETALPADTVTRSAMAF